MRDRRRGPRTGTESEVTRRSGSTFTRRAAIVTAVRVVAALALGTATCLLPGLGVPTAVAATTAPPLRPVCATSLPVPLTYPPSTPVPATPMPHAASATGGARLAAPGLQLSVPAGTPQPPAVPAGAWVVVDLKAGTVIASCNAHVPFRPASTLKLLTSLALLPHLPLTRAYTAQRSDAAIDGSKVGLDPGSGYTVRDLFYGLLLPSGNDAAHALGAMVGGDGAAAALMTRKAQALGAVDTHPVNTSGLDADGQFSSAYDLALFGRGVLHDPFLSKVVRTVDYVFPSKGVLGDWKRAHYHIQNQNKLLRIFAGTIGVKTGYTTLAEGTYVGAATRGTRSYLVAVADARGGGWKSGLSLLQWAFAHGAAAHSVGVLVNGPVATPTPTTAPTTTEDTATTGSSSIRPRGTDEAPERTATRSVWNRTLHDVEQVAAHPARHPVAVSAAGVLAVTAAGLLLLRVRRRRRQATQAGRHMLNPPT